LTIGTTGTTGTDGGSDGVGATGAAVGGLLGTVVVGVLGGAGTVVVGVLGGVGAVGDGLGTRTRPRYDPEREALVATVLNEYVPAVMGRPLPSFMFHTIVWRVAERFMVRVRTRLPLLYTVTFTRAAFESLALNTTFLGAPEYVRTDAYVLTFRGCACTTAAGARNAHARRRTVEIFASVFTAITFGGQAVCVRPLALRPRLATGLPLSSGSHPARHRPLRGYLSVTVLVSTARPPAFSRRTASELVFCDIRHSR
jgi:hypothetical protein